MLLAFELSMPNKGSWNGKWSGENDCYVRILNFSRRYGNGKTAKELANKIVSGSGYWYNFGDGWSMCVDVKQVDSKEAAKLRKKSRGFCGYDWAIDSILVFGEILNERQIEARRNAE